MAAIFACAYITLVSMSSGSRLVSGIRAFEIRIRIECDSAEMRDALDRFLLPPFPRCEISSEEAEITIELEQGSSGIKVIFNGQPVCKADTTHDAARETVKALDDELVDRLTALRAVHAGAVIFEGRALLIPGLSHAGKSSLVAELLRRGAIHLSDEYALIDHQGRVHSYPRPLLLRNGRPTQSLVLPEELNSRFATEPVPVGWIIAVDYVPGGAWEAHQISQSEAVMLLLRNTPHEMEQAPEMTDFFIRLVSDAACYAGVRGEVGEAADRVLELVASK